MWPAEGASAAWQRLGHALNAQFRCDVRPLAEFVTAEEGNSRITRTHSGILASVDQSNCPSTDPSVQPFNRFLARQAETLQLTQEILYRDQTVRTIGIRGYSGWLRGPKAVRSRSRLFAYADGTDRCCLAFSMSIGPFHMSYLRDSISASQREASVRPNLELVMRALVLNTPLLRDELPLANGCCFCV